jgi:trimeric autotransporter adhesin
MKTTKFGRGVIRANRLAVTLAAGLASTTLFAQLACPFEVGSSLNREGLVLTRYALGIRNADLVANTSFAATDIPAIEASIACPSCGLDINGVGGFDAVDATIISRKLAGFSGAALTNGLSLGGGGGRDVAAVQSFLLAGCTSGPTASNAWVLGGNAFGAPSVIGTTDAQPLTVQSGGALLSLVIPGGNGLRISQSTVANAPNVVNGSSANAVTADVRGATISGGGIPSGSSDPDYGGENPNLVTDHYGTVAGGYGNRAGNNNATVNDAAFATVGGGNANVASGSLSVVTGGYSNTASGYISSIVGGELNKAIDSYSFVGGGRSNSASGSESVVAGGRANTSPGASSAILGGTSNNTAGAEASVVGGSNNTAAGTQSVVVGGFGNIANGMGSLAAGTKAKALQNGCFVWGDTLNDNVECNTTDAFVVRARGGVSFFTAGTSAAYTGATLPAGAGAWTTLSDVNVKTAFQNIDVRAVLNKVIRMPITSWQYKAQSGVRHIGPTAQAFAQSFGLGESDTGISTVDADGVALAAIQGLNQKVESQAKLISNRDKKIDQLERTNAVLMKELLAIKKKIGM